MQRQLTTDINGGVRSLNGWLQCAACYTVIASLDRLYVITLAATGRVQTSSPPTTIPSHDASSIASHHIEHFPRAAGASATRPINFCNRRHQLKLTPKTAHLNYKLFLWLERCLKTFISLTSHFHLFASITETSTQVNSAWPSLRG